MIFCLHNTKVATENIKLSECKLNFMDTKIQILYAKEHLVSNFFQSPKYVKYS